MPGKVATAWTGVVPVEHQHYLIGEPDALTPDAPGGLLVRTLGDVDQVRLVVDVDAGADHPPATGNGQERTRVRLVEDREIRAWDYGPTFPTSRGVFAPGLWELDIVKRADGEGEVHHIRARLLEPQLSDDLFAPVEEDVDGEDGEEPVEEWNGTLTLEPGSYLLEADFMAGVNVSSTSPVRRVAVGLHLDVSLRRECTVFVSGSPFHLGGRWERVAGPCVGSGQLRFLAADGRRGRLESLPDPLASGPFELNIAQVRDAVEPDSAALMIHCAPIVDER